MKPVYGRCRRCGQTFVLYKSIFGIVAILLTGGVWPCGFHRLGKSHRGWKKSLLTGA